MNVRKMWKYKYTLYVYVLQWVDKEQSTTSCLHELAVCGYLYRFQNNWMITQYINISKLGITELVLNVSYYSTVVRTVLETVLNSCQSKHMKFIFLMKRVVVFQTNTQQTQLYNCTFNQEQMSSSPVY